MFFDIVSNRVQTKPNKKKKATIALVWRPAIPHHIIHKSMKMNLSKISQAELNLSFVADGIVSNASIVSYHLFCPFCADFYLFEFTLKDHLKREHSSLIQKHFKNVCIDSQTHPSNCDESFRIRFLNEFSHVCDLCGAMFKSAGLIPKHIVNYHGTNCFAVWRQQHSQNAIKSKGSSVENICATEMYTKYSNAAGDGIDETDDFTIDHRTPIKSILKKASASKSARIINSPSSSCIRRIKNSTSVKCASAAKRLRFDIANTSPLDLENVHFGNINIASSGAGGGGGIRKAKNSVGKRVWRMLFGPCAAAAAASKSPSKKSSTCYMVASKPLNSFDDVF